MSTESANQFVKDYWTPRKPGIDTPFHQLKPGDKFQHKEILADRKFFIFSKDEKLIRYSKDGWVKRVVPGDKMWDTIVEKI